MSVSGKCTPFGHQLRNDLAAKGFKRLMLDECGAMSIDSLAKEAIAVLILIIVFAIVPKIGMTVSSSLESPHDELETAQNALNQAQQDLQLAVKNGVTGQDLVPYHEKVDQAQAALSLTSGWASAPNGATLWTQMAGIIQIAAVILIVAIIFRAIYQFKNNK